MSTARFSHDEIVREARFNTEDMAEITKRRRDNNRLGFVYQLAFCSAGTPLSRTATFSTPASQIHFHPIPGRNHR